MILSVKKRLLYIFFLFLGISFVFLGAGVFSGVVDNKKWDVAPGRIIESQIDSRLQDSFLSRQSRIKYFPKIVYEYEVSGRYHVSDRLSLRRVEHKDPQEVVSLLGKYAMGDYVVVYYRRDAPDESVLVPVQDGQNMILVAVGCVCLLGTLLEIRQDLVKRKRSK